MGRQIKKSRFSESDFAEFEQKLRGETDILKKWFEDRVFQSSGKCLGLELETWLVDNNFLPAPENDRFLKAMDDPLVVPELSRFNAELNAEPQPLGPDCLAKIHTGLEQTWAAVQKCAQGLGLKMMMIGSLPTIRDHMLGLEYLSDKDRYRALNEQVLFLRKGNPIRLEIEGKDRIEVTHDDIMLEASATSLQIHLQVGLEEATRYFNASIVASAPMVAVAANSPYLFSRDLWDETRIPIFEQAVMLPSFKGGDGRPVGRVGFGSGYIRDSLLECFVENRDHYPVLLPIVESTSPEALRHVRLHNGTIWRWNRPIIGVEPGKKPHLRIEHRTPAAGPTLADITANVAFYVGLVEYLANQETPPESKIPFETARSNFYQGARRGLGASVKWLDGKEWDLQSLVYNELLPRAKEGLVALGIAGNDIHQYLKIVGERVRSGRTGAAWQRAFVSTHGCDFQQMAERYFNLQESGVPVHEWTV